MKMSFKQSIERDIRSIKNILEKAAFSAADAATLVLADRSKVWSGSFVSSNRLGINRINQEPPTNLKRYDPTIPVGDAALPMKVNAEEEAMIRSKAYSELRGELISKKGSIEPFGKIHITNDIEYAQVADALSKEVYSQASRVANIAAQEEFNLVNSIDKFSHL